MLHHKFLIFILTALSLSCVCTAKSTAADLDYAANLSMRTYSAGISLEPTLGLHQQLWGDSSTPFFGYIRPSLSSEFSPTSIGGKVSLDIYPLSFLGMTVAKNWTRRYAEPKGYDCAANTCLGRLDDTEIAFKLLSAYQAYFLVAQYTRRFYAENSEGNQNIMDPSNALIYRQSGSNLNTLNIILGKKISEKVSAGIIWQRGDLDRRSSASDADYFFARSDLSVIGYSMVTATFGLGRFHTDIKRPGISALAILSYTGKPGIGPAH